MAYEINININDFDGAHGNKGVSKISESEKLAQKQAKAQKDLAKYITAQTVEPFLANVKTAISQNIETMTGNAQLQQRVNFGFEMAQLGVNTYKSAMGGVVVGSALGWSTLAGAGLGIALMGLNMGIQIAFNQHQINLNERMENNQLQQVRERQGFAYNKSRR